MIYLYIFGGISLIILITYFGLWEIAIDLILIICGGSSSSGGSSSGSGMGGGNSGGGGSDGEF